MRHIWVIVGVLCGGTSLLDARSNKVHDLNEIFIPIPPKVVRKGLKIRNMRRIYKEDYARYQQFSHALERHLEISKQILSGNIASNCKNLRAHRDALQLPARLKIKNAREIFKKPYTFDLHYIAYVDAWRQFRDEYRKRCHEEW